MADMFVWNQKLLVLDPEKRISLEDVQLHPWIVKHCPKIDGVEQRSSGGSAGSR